MPLQQILTDESAEAEILAIMNDKGKFVVPIDAGLDQQQQDALERLMLRDWIRLIDVSPASQAAPHSPFQLYRVFRVMPVAVSWFKKFTRENP